ncbi:MAG: hypothetical protein KBS65_01660, partial [Prevotella sp.]|nr:hypothetical protein [Candidatus Equicola stercoris]
MSVHCTYSRRCVALTLVGASHLHSSVRRTYTAPIIKKCSAPQKERQRSSQRNTANFTSTKPMRGK